MKKNKKFVVKAIALVTALTLSASLFVGCGNTVDDKDEQGRTKLSVSAWPTNPGAALDNANAKKARFEEANPDVVIIPDAYVFDRKTFYAKAAGGQLPTYYNAGYTEMPEIIASEYAADLTDVLKKRGYEGKFNPDVLKVISDENGGIKALPNSAYVLGLSFNTELLQQAGLMEEDGTPIQPKDWNEVAEFAAKIKEATGKPGIVFSTAGGAGGWIFTAIAWSYGVDFMEKDENGKWQATFNTPETVEVLQWYKDLKWKYNALPTSTIVQNDDAYKILATGGAGMYVTAGDIPQKVVKYDMDPKILGMMAMPRGPKRHVTLLGGSVFCLNANATTDQIDAAIRWNEAGKTYELNDEFKINVEKNMKKNLDDNMLVGIKGISIWSNDVDSVKWEHEYIDQNCNVNPNHIRLYNEFVTNCPADIQPEEPVCCQELYGILDNCIQEVLTNKDADPAELIKKAASDFQANYLDNLTY